MTVNGALLVGISGAVLLGVAVSGTLLRAGYARDVATVCDAELASGFHVSRSAARVTAWLDAHLTTPEGGRLLASLRDRPVAERGRWLEQRSREAGRMSCPMVQAYQELSDEWDARREIQSLCSTVTFPDLATFDDATRLQVIDEWIETRGSTAVVRALRPRLQRAETAPDRAEVLSHAASDLGVLTCDVAKILSVPVKRSCGP